MKTVNKYLKNEILIIDYIYLFGLSNENVPYFHDLSISIIMKTNCSFDVNFLKVEYCED